MVNLWIYRVNFVNQSEEKQCSSTHIDLIQDVPFVDFMYMSVDNVIKASQLSVAGPAH